MNAHRKAWENPKLSYLTDKGPPSPSQSQFAKAGGYDCFFQYSILIDHKIYKNKREKSEKHSLFKGINTSPDTDPKQTQISDLLDKDFKTLLNMLKELKENAKKKKILKETRKNIIYEQNNNITKETGITLKKQTEIEELKSTTATF